MNEPLSKKSDRDSSDESASARYDPARGANLPFLFQSPGFKSFLMRMEKSFLILPVFKDFFLIILPTLTWNRLAARQHGVGFTFLFYLLPMMSLLTVVEGNGLMLLGKQQVAEGMNNRFTFARVLVYETGSGLLTLSLVFVASLMTTHFANACHRRNRLSQSLVVMLQAVGPMLFIQLFNGFPNIYLWLTWFGGVTVAIGSLYHGLPRILQPDPPSALGLYCASAFVLLLVMFAERFLTYWYLIGQFKSVEALVVQLAGKLPF